MIITFLVSGFCVGSVRLRVWVCNAIWIPTCSYWVQRVRDPTRGPNAKGFAFQWNMGVVYLAYAVQLFLFMKKIEERRAFFKTRVKKIPHFSYQAWPRFFFLTDYLSYMKFFR